MDFVRWVFDCSGTHRVKALTGALCRLRVQLLVLILAAAVPMVGLVLYTDYAWRRHDIRDTNRHALGLARLAAVHQEQIVEGAHDLLLAMTRAPAVRHSDPACPRILAAFRRSFPRYADFGVIQTNGNVSCSALPVHGSTSLGDRPFFRRALETRDFVVGDVMVGPLTGRPTIHFATPIFGLTNDIQAIIFAGLDLDWLETYLAQTEFPAGVTITLIDKDGVVLARAPAARQWLGQSALTVPIVRAVLAGQHEGTAITSDLDGVKKLLAVTRIRGAYPTRGLYVAVGVPLAEAFAEADSILTRNLAALGGLGIGVILLAWFGADVVVLRRTRAMVGMAQRLSAGDLSARSGVQKGSGELDQLAAAFDNMATELEKRQVETHRAQEALRNANEELENRVRDRTAHLLAANEAQQVALRDLKRAQDHLDEQKAQLAGIIDSAMEAIITIDEDHQVILFNRTAERVFRLPAAEAIGRPVERFIPERFRALHQAGLGLLDRPGVGGDRIEAAGSAFAVRADGEEFPMEAAVSHVEVRGEALYTIILRDISERLKTEDMLRKLSLAVEKTTESVFITNRDGIIEYVNPGFENLTGYRREETIGRTPRILKSGEHDAEFYRAVWKTILSGNVFSGVFLNRKKTGETFYEERSITPIRGDGQSITHFVAAGRDITRRKRTEEALRRLNAQLEREAERIAHALHDDAGQFLTSAHITLANMAHGLPPETQGRLLEVRAHLDRIEEDLRRLSHELRPRILADLGLAAALEFLADGVMKRAGIVVTTEVALEERLPLLAETTLYRFVQEALTNAAKHSRSTRINVLVARDGRTIRCAVQDDGIGFDAADTLGRLGAPSLGLVGTRDRVEALGGILNIASTPGKGTELLALIPVDPAES